MIQFYCYKKCSTCKKAEGFLQTNHIDYEFIDITKRKFTSDDIRLFHEKSGKELKKLFNTSGNLYKEMGLKDQIPHKTEDELIELLSSDGYLLKRPILVTEDKVLIGFDEEQYQELL